MNSMNGVVIIGPPACGKSTISKQVADVMGWTYISSGDIARKMAKTCTETSENLKVGKLAEENQMRDKIYHALYEINASNRTFVLDGFPRNEEQLDWLLKRFPATLFYLVDVPCRTCKSRSNKRDRADDNVFDTRLNYYNEYTSKMADKISCTIGIRAIKNIKVNYAVGSVKADILERMKVYDRK